MKKIIVILMAGVLLATLFGCTGKVVDTNASVVSSPSTYTSETSSDIEESTSEIDMTSAESISTSLTSAGLNSTNSALADITASLADDQPRITQTQPGVEQPSANQNQNNTSHTTSRLPQNDTTNEKETITSKEKEKEKDDTTSTSKAPEPPQISISLDKSTITIDIGQTSKINASVSPNGTSVSWSSADDSIATVNVGTITGRSVGTTVIYAKAGDKEARCTIVVKEVEKSFSPDSYVTYAKSHATKIGLVYDEALLGLSSNAWINLYSSLSDAQMKKDIEDGLQILKNENRTYYKLYLEKISEKSYRLYIYYG